MPAERLTHPREGHSRKLRELSDFEYRVWCTYRWAANDVGVMRDAPTPLMDANAVLEERGTAVRKALNRLIAIGLLLRFEHRGDSYVCSPEWQDHQRVRHPSRTHLPTPTGDVLAACSEDTQELFRKLSEKMRKSYGDSPQNSGSDSGSVAEIIPDLSGESSESDRESFLRAPARKALAIAQATANAPEGEPEREAPPKPREVPRGEAELLANAVIGEWNERVRRSGSSSLVEVPDDPASRPRLLAAVRLRPSIDDWRKILDLAFASDYLMGRVPGRDGTPFHLTAWWLLENAHKVLAGAYVNRNTVIGTADAKAAKERADYDARYASSQKRLAEHRAEVAALRKAKEGAPQ